MGRDTLRISNVSAHQLGDDEDALTSADEDLVLVLDEAWRSPFTTRCDFARDNAEVIAIASHHRYLTTAASPTYNPEEFGRIWRVTPKGLEALWQYKG